MKVITFFTAVLLFSTISFQAKAADKGYIKSISCFNSEMSNEEAKLASISVLGMKTGDSVSLIQIRKLVTNEDGTAKEGMGTMESHSTLVVFIKAAGLCQKDKVEKLADGTEKTVSTIGTITISIHKN